jgi:hypothetical protein
MIVEAICCEYFYKITRRHIEKLGIANILHIQNMMEREDFRMVKIAFKDPKNCQNRE